MVCPRLGGLVNSIRSASGHGRKGVEPRPYRILASGRHSSTDQFWRCGQLSAVCQVQTCEQEWLRVQIVVWQLLERRVAAIEPSSCSARTTTAVSISFQSRKGLSRPYHRTELRRSKAVSWPRKRLPPPKTRRANLLRPPSVASKSAPRRQSRQDSGTRDGDPSAAVQSHSLFLEAGAFAW